MNAVSFFNEHSYASKEDIKLRVAMYHEMINREFKLVKSDSRRYSCKCLLRNCGFKIRFKFLKGNFSRPIFFAPHSCSLNESLSTKRVNSVEYLSKWDVVKEWVLCQGRSATPKDLRRFLNSKGKRLSYIQVFRLLKKVKEDIFIDDNAQFMFLEDYINVLNSKLVVAKLERDGKRFKRLGIIYREGVQSFSCYYQRGLQLDGTFLTNKTKGVLLVACFRDGNNNIRIVGVAVCSCENEENWTWFVDIIK